MAFTGLTARGLYIELRFPTAMTNTVITQVTTNASRTCNPPKGSRSSAHTSAMAVISISTRNAAARFLPARTVDIFTGTRKYTWAALRSNPKQFQNSASLIIMSA